MSDVIRVTAKPPFRDLKGRFTKAEEGLLEDRREMVRALGRRYVEIAREEAPERTGKFKKSLIFRTFIKGQAVGFSAYSAQPLGTYIVEGTQAHIIRAKKARALRFQVGGEWVFRRAVHHPGTQANPYHERAQERWEPEAAIQLARISRNYVVALQGKAS